MTTAIISALPEEQAGLLHLLSNHEHLAKIPRRVELGLMHGKPVILALAGIGKVAAATTATMLIERHKVERILFTGVAGGIAPQVQVGDVVVGSHYLQHDMDASPQFPRYEVPLYGMSEFTADQDLLSIILEALRAQFITAKSPKPFKIHKGLILSGDCFVKSAEQVLSLREALPQALCVEMEGAAVAQVCHDYGLPFVALRTISDRADESAYVDFSQFIQTVAGPLAVKMIDTIMARLAHMARA
jgi:adenosylhomocysteine nucleosidase